MSALVGTQLSSVYVGLKRVPMRLIISSAQCAGETETMKSEPRIKSPFLRSVLAGMNAYRNDPANQEPCGRCDCVGYLFTQTRRKVECDECGGIGHTFPRLFEDLQVGGIGGAVLSIAQSQLLQEFNQSHH